MIDDLDTWKSTYKELPKVSTGIWTTNFSDWVADRVVDAEITGVTTADNPFTFDKSVFKSMLDIAVPTIIPATGILQFAVAWETAVNASLVLNVAADDFVGPPPPTNATKWSEVATALIDSDSVLLGKAKIITLGLEAPVELEDDSKFPKILREAFLLLTGSISGTDTTPSPAGPLPLSVVKAPLV